MVNISRRAILGGMAAAPVVAASVGQSPMPTPPMDPYSVGPSPFGSLAGAVRQEAQSALGIGPWLKAGMDEAKWRAMRALHREVCQRLERSYDTDYQVEAMKSWAPHFKATVRAWKKEALLEERDALDRLLHPFESNPS